MTKVEPAILQAAAVVIIDSSASVLDECLLGTGCCPHQHVNMPASEAEHASDLCGVQQLQLQCGDGCAGTSVSLWGASQVAVAAS